MAKITGIKEKAPTITGINYADREILFLGMTHLGKKKFYKNSRNIISDLKSKGFQIYVESISIIRDNEIFTDTIYAKKMRKIVGIDPTVSYDDVQNILWKLFKIRYNLVIQPPYEDLGATNFKVVDVTYDILIDLYEKEYGAIVMDSCDIKTDLGNTSYKCKLLPDSCRKNFESEFILDLRNMFIVETIKQSTDKKILLIYGKGHLEGIKHYLEEID